MRDIEGFCDNLFPSPTTQKRQSLVRKPLKRVLKTCDKDAEVSLFIVDDFWAVIFKGLTTGEFDHDPITIWTTQIELYCTFFLSFSFFFFREVTKVRRWIWED